MAPRFAAPLFAFLLRRVFILAGSPAVAEKQDGLFDGHWEIQVHCTWDGDGRDCGRFRSIAGMTVRISGGTCFFENGEVKEFSKYGDEVSLELGPASGESPAFLARRSRDLLLWTLQVPFPVAGQRPAIASMWWLRTAAAPLMPFQRPPAAATKTIIVDARGGGDVTDVEGGLALIRREIVKQLVAFVVPRDRVPGITAEASADTSLNFSVSGHDPSNATVFVAMDKVQTGVRSWYVVAQDEGSAEADALYTKWFHNKATTKWVLRVCSLGRHIKSPDCSRLAYSEESGERGSPPRTGWKDAVSRKELDLGIQLFRHERLFWSYVLRLVPGEHRTKGDCVWAGLGRQVRHLVIEAAEGAKVECEGPGESGEGPGEIRIRSVHSDRFELGGLHTSSTVQLEVGPWAPDYDAGGRKHDVGGRKRRYWLLRNVQVACPAAPTMNALVLKEDGSRVKRASVFEYNCVHVTATDSHVRLDGLSTAGGGLSVTARSSVVQADNMAIVDGVRAGMALSVGSGSDISVRRTSIVNSHRAGIRLHVYNGSSATLEDVLNANSGADGIMVSVDDGKSSARLRRVRSLSNHGSGLKVDIQGAIVLSDVESVDNMEHGITIACHAPDDVEGERHDSADVSNIKVTGNIEAGMRFVGVRAVRADGVTATSNEGFGLIVFGAASATVRSVFAANNSIGLSVRGRSLADPEWTRIEGDITLKHNVLGFLAHNFRGRTQDAIFYVVENFLGVKVLNTPHLRLKGITYYNDREVGYELPQDGAVDLLTPWVLQISYRTLCLSVGFLCLFCTLVIVTLPMVLLVFVNARAALLWALLLSLTITACLLVAVNMALWDRDIYPAACRRINFMVIGFAVAASCTRAFMSFLTGQIVKQAAKEAKESLGKEQVRQFISMSEFGPMRLAVDELNLSFQAMDPFYIERLDEEKGYSMAQIIEQDRIIRRILRGCRKAKGGPPWVLFLAGGPGSGKGTVLRHLVKAGVIPRHVALVDFDDMRMQLSAFRQSKDKNEATQQTQAQAGYMAELALEYAAQTGVCAVSDACLHGETWHRHYFAHLRSRGVRLAILFVEAEVETCKARVVQRAADTGRPVPEDIVVSRNTSCRTNARLLRDEVECWAAVFNNDVPTFSPEGASEWQLQAFLHASCRDNFGSFLRKSTVSSGLFGGGTGGLDERRL